MTAQSSMYLAGQSHDNDFDESAAGDVIVIENEELPNGSTTENWQPSTSSSTRDRETHPMRQHPDAQMRLRNDEDDDDDNDEQEEEELPGNNVTCFSSLLSFALMYTRVFLSKELITVFGDGKTHATKSDADRLGHFPFKANAVPDRMPPRLGLHLLPSIRHLNLLLLALSRDIEMIDTIRYDIQHDRIHTFTFTFMYIYYVQYIIRTLHFWY